MTSLSAKLINTAIQFRIKKPISSPKKLVRHLRHVASPPIPIPLPSNITKRADTIAGVPGKWIEVKNPIMTLIYFHGGAFIAGDIATYYHFTAELAKRLKARVFLVDYRLAPEHPFPAGINDCYAVYKSIRQRSPEIPLVIMGDSAGGSLTLTTMIRAKEDNIAMPDCAVAISPGGELHDQVHSRTSNAASDVMLASSVFSMLPELYCPGEDLTSPLISPCRADYSSFPPLFITVSEHEALRDDAYMIKAAADNAGVTTQILSRRGMPHIWPVLFPFLKEAKQDLPVIVNFIQKHTALPNHAASTITA